MPTISAHVSDEFAEVIEKAALSSPEKKVGPWITEAVRLRLERDGMLPGDPQAEILAYAQQIGFQEAAAILVRAARKQKSASAAAR